MKFITIKPGSWESMSFQKNSLEVLPCWLMIKRPNRGEESRSIRMYRAASIHSINSIFG